MRIPTTMAHLTIALVVVLLVVITTGCSHNKQLAEENRLTSTRLAELEKRLSQLESERNKARVEADNLQRELAQLAEKEKLSLQKLDKYTVLTLPNNLVFGSGSTQLSNEGISVLAKIADIFKRYPDYEIRVEGHTDNKQIKPEFQHRFLTNWELASARATTVVRHLIATHKMDPRKLGAVGYGEHRPTAGNETEQGRAKNRRVEFHIYPVMQSKVLS